MKARKNFATTGAYSVSVYGGAGDIGSDVSIMLICSDSSVTLKMTPFSQRF